MDRPDVAGDLIGLDIGGTKTHGVRFRGSTPTPVPVAEAKAGSANIQNVSRAEAARNLASLFGSLGPEPIARVIAGAGGVDTDDDAAALCALIAPLAPTARITAVHDSRLILAAGEADAGIAIIAGTGAAAWGRTPDGDEARAGGWGYLLGDEGSAYWLGREAVRHALRLHDAGQTPDQLSRRLLEACGLEQAAGLVAAFHGDTHANVQVNTNVHVKTDGHVKTGRSYWADKAVVVFAAAEAGSAPAAELIGTSASELSALAIQVAAQLQMSGPVVIGGGLARHQRGLRRQMTSCLAGAGLHDLRFLDQDPVFGVPRLARY